MRQIITVVVLAITFNSTNLFSQNDSIKYTFNYRFVDGIYRSFEEFKKNDPSIDEKAIIADNPEVQFLIGNFAKVEKIAFLDSTGQLQKLKRDEVWGYCSKGAVYIMVNNNFHRIVKIGSIMHFAESHNKFFYSRQMPVSGINKPNKYIQYMIDFNTGELMKFKLENFLILLKHDEELYEQFNSFKSNSQKKKMMFLYLNKFNQRNPIYFEVY